MRDGRLVQFGELCGVSADVRFAPDFVRFTPNSGRGKHPRGTSQFDPQRKSNVSAISLDTAPNAADLACQAGIILSPSKTQRLLKIGAKVVRHGRYVTFQLAEVAVPRELFRKILSLIDDLRPRPAPA